eukprot:GFUD01026945.1.p1 GENE.GFUD01026945.1~~GFUD01026945.1.p1  ORF type:complete len:205 (-),score=63.93 GFUD01026945.1:72-686(-)
MNLFRPQMFLTPMMGRAKLLFSTSIKSRGTFEPDYLDSSGPVIPTYPPLNIQIKGYNFDALESMQSYIHNLAENMGIDVETAWATPAKTFQLTTFIEGGVRPKENYNVNMYERNVHVVGLRSVDAPILIDTIRIALPEGVMLSVHEHTREMGEERWIADPFIDQLRSELDTADIEKEKEQVKKDATNEAKAARKKELLLKSLTD